MVVVEGLGCGGYIDLDILVSLRLGPDGQMHTGLPIGPKTAAAVATVSIFGQQHSQVSQGVMTIFLGSS